jgi:hypothetical protein
VRERLERLYDEPRPGALRQISDEEIQQVIVRTLEHTASQRNSPEQSPHGESQRLLAHDGASRSGVPSASNRIKAKRLSGRPDPLAAFVTLAAPGARVELQLGIADFPRKSDSSGFDQSEWGDGAQR